MFHVLVMTIPSSYLIWLETQVIPRSGVFSIASPHCVRPIDHVANTDREVLACGIVAFSVGGGLQSVASRNHWNITGSGTLEKSHSAYPCEVVGGSSLSESWYDSSSVEMRFLVAKRW
jgi:hypothetical protein